MKSEISTRLTKNIIKIIDLPEVDYSGYYKIIDEKTVKYIEKLIRNSYEYRSFIKYLKLNLEIDHCTFFENFGLKNGFSSIEFHHHPLTLYDYTYIVCKKHLELFGNYNDMEVAEEVMRIHYQFMVSLVPLSSTVHDSIHSNETDIKISPDMTIGYVDSFINEYNQYLDENIKEKYKEFQDLEKKEINLPKILEKQESILLLPFEKVNKESVTKLIENKIESLKIT